MTTASTLRLSALLALTVSTGALTGCAESAMYTDGVGADEDFGDTGFDDAPNQAPGRDTADAGLPDEVEDDARLLRPAQSDAYVFVASPDRDTVTRINVQTRGVRTVAVGRVPGAVQVTDDYVTAVVLNKGDDTVSILDSETLSQTVVEVRPQMNAMALSPDGRFAVLWRDLATEAREGVITGLRGSAVDSYNEVTVVELATATASPLVVGFNPKGVQFTPDGALALMVSDAYLSRIALTPGERPVREAIPIADPLSAPEAAEVVVSPDGGVAFIRQAGVSAVTVVDLDTGEVQQTAVGEGPTDLDLTPDGTGAVVVSRTARELAVFDVASPLDAPRVVPFPADLPFGSVLMGPGDEGILYTTASPIDRYAQWSLTDDGFALFPLPKPIEAITRTPTGESLLVLHGEADNGDGSTPPQYEGRPAVTLIPIGDEGSANTIALDAVPSGFVTSPDGRRGYLILEGLPFLEVLDFETLIYDELPLRSAPVFVGVLPDLDPDDGDQPAAWVTQEHSLGRISFYEPDSGALQTITGFELNGAVEE